MSLGAGTQARVFWRCLFLQAAWSRRAMQGLGFAYAIDPALRALYPDKTARLAALERHLGFFNCHPYMAAAILGGAIHHEELVARGQEPAGDPVAYKAALQGPLAAVGDGFFWTALRPFFGALAALGALLQGWQSVAAAVVLYNAVHLWLRWRFFRDGDRHGDEVVLDIRDLHLRDHADRLRVAAAALCGLATALFLAQAGGGLGSSGALAAGGTALLGWVGLARGLPLLGLGYAALLAGALATFVLGGGP